MTEAWGKVVRSLVVSFVIVVCVYLAAWGTSRGLGPVSQRVRTWLQVTGAALTFWGVYAKLGWDIQTWNGHTPPEVFNVWFFRIVTGIGMALVAYTLLAPCAES